MGEHSTWFDLLPGLANLKTFASHYMAREGQWMMFAESHFTLNHVFISLMLLILLTIGVAGYRKRVAVGADGRLVPDDKFTVRNFFEMILELVLSLSEGVMGRKNAEKYLPLIGTLFIFILFNNYIGLIPGFLPTTDTLKTNVALAGVVFLMTHYLGVKEHGFAYLKHFLGPVWYLAPLMLVIEIVSHIARPISLALRLMGNMFGDHKVLATFFMLVPILIPIPFFLLGMVVCLVQAVVFTLLSIVYIDMAVAHDGH